MPTALCFFDSQTKKFIFAPRFVPTWGFILHFGLKGNRVRVPDSPAAVTFSRGLLKVPVPLKGKEINATV